MTSMPHSPSSRARSASSSVTSDSIPSCRRLLRSFSARPTSYGPRVHGSWPPPTRERRRIERDLHDGAQQYLVGLAANLRAAQDLISSDPERARAILEELSGTVGRGHAGVPCSLPTASTRPSFRIAGSGKRSRTRRAGFRFPRRSIPAGSAATAPRWRRRSTSAASRRSRTPPSTGAEARLCDCGSRTATCASRSPTTGRASIRRGSLRARGSPTCATGWARSGGPSSSLPQTAALRVVGSIPLQALRPR